MSLQSPQHSPPSPRPIRRFYHDYLQARVLLTDRISGIADANDLEHYATVVLHRLIFVCFVRPPQLFRHSAPDERNRHLCSLLHSTGGKSSSLRGGLFQQHPLELKYPKLEIRDDTAKALLAIFDRYRWQLTPTTDRSARTITPEIVGHVLEQQIHHKPMGTYYTQRDVTGYICRVTLIPLLLKTICSPDSQVLPDDSYARRLLQHHPDRYLYPAMRHGIIDKGGEAIPLPDNVAGGIGNMADRRNWNELADGRYGLVHETWREHIDRRRHCLEWRSRLTSGQPLHLSDFITGNLDLHRFALDVIDHCPSPEIVYRFYLALQDLTILDPTCGSGAFLLEALDLLESLAGAVLDRMAAFVEGSPRDARSSRVLPAGFHRVLDRFGKPPSRRYRLLRFIVLHNLYGVDLMPEAVETCRMLLLLRLAAACDSDAQQAALPDLDFNIQPGNALVGIARMEELKQGPVRAGGGKLTVISRRRSQVNTAARLLASYRRLQTDSDACPDQLGKQKEDLRKRLDRLDDSLDRILASRFDLSLNSHRDVDSWKTSHQPFHWLVRFADVLSSGRFAVVVGNPPYLESSQIEYRPVQMSTLESKAVHAMCIERSLELLSPNGSLGMIVPLALVSTQRMKPLQQLIEQHGFTWYANFAWRPAKLFATVNRALTIFVSHALQPTIGSLQHTMPQATRPNVERGSADWDTGCARLAQHSVPQAARPNVERGSADWDTGCARLTQHSVPQATRPSVERGSADWDTGLKTFSTGYCKWFQDARDVLFSTLRYHPVPRHRSAHWVPKLGDPRDGVILEKLLRVPTRMSDFVVAKSPHGVYYRTTGGLYWKVFTDFPPTFRRNGKPGSSSRQARLSLRRPDFVPAAISLLSSNLFWWWYSITSNLRDLNPSDLLGFPTPAAAMNDRRLVQLGHEYLDDLKRHRTILVRMQHQTGKTETDCFKVQRSKPVIDRIDQVLAEHYGLTAEELDRIIHYDIKFRMGIRSQA